MQPKKGLILSVYKVAGEDGCTNGPTRQAKRVLLVGPGVPEIFEATGLPVFVLARGPGGNAIAVSADASAGSWPMFGGNFIGTSDSRFVEAARMVEPGWNHWLVPVFDRDESQSFGSSTYHAFSFAEDGGAVRAVIAEAEVGLEDGAVADFVVMSVMGGLSRINTNDEQSWVLNSGKGIKLTSVTSLSFHEYETMQRIQMVCTSITLVDYQNWADLRGAEDLFVIRPATNNMPGVEDNYFWNEGQQSWVTCLDQATRYTLNDRLRIRPHRMPKALMPSGNEPRSVFVAVSAIVID